jgi:hypothetical protein
MMLHRWILAAGVFSGSLLMACSSPTAKPTGPERVSGSAAGSALAVSPPPTIAAASAVVIAVASITLADDCPSESKTASIEAEPKAKSKADRGNSPAKREAAACVQTAVQLDLRSSATAATTITLRKVELVDATGKVLGELTPRAPDRWTDEGSYVAWDQALAAGATLKASWPLSSPDWAKYGTTKAAAATQVFQLRLTVAVNGADQIVAGQATVMSPPAINEAPMKT